MGRCQVDPQSSPPSCAWLYGMPPCPFLLSKAPGNASLLGWATTQVTQHSILHNGQGWGHSMELKWLRGGQIWVTIITTGRLCRIMWSGNWRNLPPQTSSKCFPKKNETPKGNKLLHFPIEMLTTLLSKPKILCCNACPPTTLPRKIQLHWDYVTLP